MAAGFFAFVDFALVLLGLVCFAIDLLYHLGTVRALQYVLMTTDEQIEANKTPARLVLFVIVLNFVVISLAVLAWGQPRNWSVSSLYQLFPLFGLLAFSLMWCHYVTAAILRASSSSIKLSSYFKWTGYAVLALILLHPGLLIYQLWSDGQGLPPFSYVDYVGQASKLAVILGSVSLLCFLLYETKSWLSKTVVWPYIVALSDIAMMLIVIHGLKLGSSLQSGWYKTVWVIYGVVLIACILGRLVYSKPTDKLQETA